MIENYYNRNLPKWPNLIIRGKPITVDQAKEVIFKTDNYFYDSHKGFSNWATDRLTWYRDRAGLRMLDIYGEMVHEALDKRNEDGATQSLNDELNFPNLYSIHDRLTKALGVEKFEEEIQYVRNDLADSCYVGGANGYVDANGTISFDRNVGKWPSVEEIHNDFRIIAEEFPFLEMYASLYDAEQCERDEKPVNLVVSFIISNGKVIIGDMDFNLDSYDSSLPDYGDDDEMEFLKNNILNGTGSCGIPEEWFYEFADRVKDTMVSSGIYDELSEIIKKYKG